MPTRTREIYSGGQLVGTEQYDVPQEQVNREDLETKARNALQANQTFLAIGSPTNAQTLAQVRLLTRETSALIRLLLNALDTTEGT